VNVLVVGATSDIAVEIARLHASKGDRLLLVARDAAALDDIAADLRVRGAAAVDIDIADAAVPDEWDRALASALARSAVDRAYIAHGVLPNEQLAQSDRALLRRALEVNAVSAIAAFAAIAEGMEARGSGRMVVISTVATDRARSSVALYGAGKAAVEYYAGGIAMRWSGRPSLGVTVVKPGRVATKMTAHLPRTLMATREAVALQTVTAADRNADVAYVPRYWGVVMFVIRMLPRVILARLPL
jgi:short-subunit dehydrogenase